MELFEKILNGFQTFTFFSKRSIFEYLFLDFRIQFVNDTNDRLNPFFSFRGVLEPCKALKTERFAKILKVWKPSTIFC